MIEIHFMITILPDKLTLIRNFSWRDSLNDGSDFRQYMKNNQHLREILQIVRE